LIFGAGAGDSFGHEKPVRGFVSLFFLPGEANNRKDMNMRKKKIRTTYDSRLSSSKRTLI
jgi:hypothetical protein